MAFCYWSWLEEGLGDDEEEDLPEPRKYHFMDRKGEKLANSMCSKRFKTTFRKSIDTFDEFENLVYPLVEGVGSTNGMSIEPREKMQNFLSFCGSSLFYNNIVNTFGVSTTMAHNIGKYMAFLRQYYVKSTSSFKNDFSFYSLLVNQRPLWKSSWIYPSPLTFSC